MHRPTLKQGQNKGNGIKPPDSGYHWSENQMEQSVLNKNEWIDSMFIFSLIWAFGSILTNDAKVEFNKWLMTCMNEKEAQQLQRQKEFLEMKKVRLSPATEPNSPTSPMPRQDTTESGMSPGINRDDTQGTILTAEDDMLCQYVPTVDVVIELGSIMQMNTESFPRD